ncbi:hypothetical protein D3C76_1234560 [compost metagenome]
MGQGLDPGLTANAQRATVFVGVRHELHPGHQAGDGIFWCSVAGQGQGAMGHAMVGPRETDDVIAPGVGLGQFQRGLHRIRPGRSTKLQAVIATLVRQQAEQGFAKGILDHGGQVQRVHRQT